MFLQLTHILSHYFLFLRSQRVCLKGWRILIDVIGLYPQNRFYQRYNNSNNDSDSLTSFSDISRYTIGDVVSKVIPPLITSSHKGSSGRIGILGGSLRYTGAPYYAAISSLRSGAELVYIFCADEAIIPIQCYSPELIVTGVYNACKFDRFKDKNDRKKNKRKLVEDMVEKVQLYLDHLHVLIIGPGLGRCPLVLNATAKIIKKCQKRGLNVVLDADALYLLSLKKYQSVLYNTSKSTIVLTPNAVEYERLINSTGIPLEVNMRKSMCKVILIRKGFYDHIKWISPVFLQNMSCYENGGLKRIGGLGDILSGIVGIFMAWNTLTKSREDELMLACWLACYITKVATRDAFKKKERSMTAADVLEEIGDVFHSTLGF